MEQKKIDRRHKYLIVLDTETANGLDDALFYDCGWCIIDTKGRIYETRSFVNREIFDNEELMNSAYYIDKKSMYEEQIKNGQRNKVNLWIIKNQLWNDMKTYNTKIVVAHNCRFDFFSCNKTQRYLTKSKYRFFFPCNTIFWDTLKFSRDTLKNNPRYKKFCRENDFMTKHSTPREKYTAEVLYRFITNNLDFEESHTGLEDTLIEKDILVYCLKKNPKGKRLLWE